MSIYQPYTYLIGWSKLNRWYYGAQYGRKASPNNLWKTYFTSSKYVKKFREENGEPDIIEIRKIFRTSQQTLRCEEKVLLKLNAAQSNKWLNAHNGNKNFYGNKGGNNKGTKRPDAALYMKKNNPMNNEIYRIKMIKMKKGIPSHRKGKKQPATNKWITNGIESKYINKTLPIPDGFRLGRIIRHNFKHI